MDSHFVEFTAQRLRAEYPDLVRTVGERLAQEELHQYLGDLVTNSILDPTDAEELEARTLYSGVEIDRTEVV